MSYRYREHAHTLTRAEYIAARGGLTRPIPAAERTRPHRYAPRHTFNRDAPFADLVIAADALADELARRRPDPRTADGDA